MHVYILTNDNNEYEWRYIPGDEIINSQIIIKKSINGTILIYNFNADKQIDTTGQINEHMDELLGIDAGFNYERRIVNPYEIHFTKIGSNGNNNENGNGNGNSNSNSNENVETSNTRNVKICIEP